MINLSFSLNVPEWVVTILTWCVSGWLVVAIVAQAGAVITRALEINLARKRAEMQRLINDRLAESQGEQHD